MSDPSGALRTGIYIDGYNLYYGRLRGTPYKWLDVVALFQRIVHSIEPRTQVCSVNFFTAPVGPVIEFPGPGEFDDRP